MSRRRRQRRRRGRGAGAAFSLFSFQDIMAAVTGVMMVTTLLLVVDLLTRTTAAVPGADADAKAEAGVVFAVPPEADAARRPLELLALLEAEASAPLVSPTQLEAIRREQAALAERVEALRDAQAAAASSTRRVRRQSERLRLEAAALSQARTDAEQQITRAQEHPPVTLLAGESSGPPSWWVRVGSTTIRAGELQEPGGGSQQPETRTWPTLDAFLREAATLSADERSWVLLVEADAMGAFARAQGFLRGLGFAVGWDLAPPEAPSAPPPGRGQAGGGRP